MLDVFYISYNESFADENYEMLKVFAPHAQRVHGVKGIFEAHKKAAEQSNTTHFYVVDADAIIEEVLFKLLDCFPNTKNTKTNSYGL